MKQWLFSVTRFAAVAILVVGCTGDDGRGDPFFFVQLSDPQFGMYTADSSFVQESANLQLAVATVNRLRPSFVIVTGDLVNQVGNRDEIAGYQRAMSSLDRGITLYNVPGNHDVGNQPTAETIAAWRKRFGPDHYTFTVGDLTGIVLNSSLIADPRGAPDLYEAQERWLFEQLERAQHNRAQHVVIFQHHPWYVDSVDEADTYSNIPRVRRAKYLAMFRQFGVRTLIAGHDHRYNVARDVTFQMVASGSVGKPRDGGKSGLAVVTVNTGGLHHRYYDFGELPNRVIVR